MDRNYLRHQVVIIGSGPASLMAAEVLSKHGVSVLIIESEKRAGKKFLVAGDGGLNLTHSEKWELFVKRYSNPNWAQDIISVFPPSAFIQWLNDIGISTFIGSSGRYFPSKEHKPAQVLSTWLNKLEKQGVTFAYNTKLIDIDNNNIKLDNKEIESKLNHPFVIFALGGKSWQKTGSTGSWANFFTHHNLLPSNVGLHTSWSNYFQQKFEGKVLKYVKLSYKDEHRIGDVIITKNGIESTPVYHISRQVVKDLDTMSQVIVYMDLKPNTSEDNLKKLITENDTWQTCLKKWKLHPAQKALIVEMLGKKNIEVSLLLKSIKKLPIIITGHDGFNTAISTQGGIIKENVNADLSSKTIQNWYFVGEMLDQDAPTGGYLIQHAVSSGYVAAKSILTKLNMLH